MHIAIIDVLIVVLLIGSLFRGYQIGFIRQLSSTIAFLLGLYPGSILASKVMEHTSGPSKPLVGLAILLTVSFVLMTIAELLAVRLKFSIKSSTLQKIDNGLGSAVAIVTLLLGVWLAAALFQLAPTSSFQGAIKDSRIIGVLNRKLPPVNSVLSSLSKLIDPNQSPQVFAGREPSPSANYTLPDPSVYSAMLASVQPSVVKIEGLGCGGIVDGSGFVYSDGRVVTNAHVVAGVQDPKIRDANGTHSTTVVLFDPDNDIAVLRATDLAGKPLTINNKDAANGTGVFVLGYPGGGAYTVQSGAIIEKFTAIGQDIYAQAYRLRSFPETPAAPLSTRTGKYELSSLLLQPRIITLATQ